MTTEEIRYIMDMFEMTEEEAKKVAEVFTD